MNNFYINIDNSYSTTGTGISSNPYNYTQFKTHIASGLISDTTYYIEGVRTLGVDETADFYINATISTVNVVLTNRLKSPWYITTTQVGASQNKITFNTGNVASSSSYMSPKSLRIQNGVLALYNYETIIDQLNFDNIDGRLDSTINLDNMFIEMSQVQATADSYPRYFNINNFSSVNITNSNLITKDNQSSFRNSALVITNYNSNCDVSIKNCFVNVGNILTTNEASNNNINITLDNNIFGYDYTKVLTDNWTYSGYIFPASFITEDTYVFCNIISNTNVANLDVTGDEYTDLYNIATRLNTTSATDEIKSAFYYNYYSDVTYSTIGNYKNYKDTSIKGNIDLQTSANDFFDGLRDGVGAYYFPTPDLEISTTSTSGTTPYTVTTYTEANIPNIYSVEFNAYSDDTTTSATAIATKKYTFNFYDTVKVISYDVNDMNFYGPEISTIDTSAIDTTLVSSNPISADYIYTEPGVYDIQVSANSLNGWNTYASNVVQVSAFASSLSADIEVYDTKTNTIITSAEAYQDIQVKIFNFVGGINSLDIDFNDTSASDIVVDSSELFIDYYYTTSSVGPITITLNNNMGQTSAISALFVAGNSTQSEYYVDINNSYVGSNNIGTEAKPFNYSELVTRLTTSGDFSDIYYLRGLRKIEDSRALLSVNQNKSFIIDVWDAKQYGPWVLVVNEYSTTQATNSLISFKGASVKNGIIYNKLNDIGGGILEISDITDMYIVWQGFSSILKITQDEYNKVYDQCRIKASTIYSENGVNFNKIDKAISAILFN